MKLNDDSLKALLYSQGLSDEAAASWLDYYEEAVTKGKVKQEASDYAWEKLKQSWRLTSNGKWEKYEQASYDHGLFNGPMPVIEVFRAGDYPQRSISIEDLDVMASEYNPAIFEAPVTIDHIQDGPAYGWVASIYRSGESLYAVLRNLSEKLIEKVKKEEYRNRSIEIFGIEYKGKFIWPYFRAVTFLGAKVPQVLGMAEPVFMSAIGKYSDSGKIEILNLDNDDKMKLNREGLISLYKRGEGKMEMTKEQLEAERKQAADKAVAEYKQQHKVDQTQKDFEAQKTENERLKTELADVKKGEQEAWAKTQFEHLKSQGKLLPAEEGWFTSMMKVLSPDKAEIEFSSEIKGTPAKALVEFFNRMKARVEFKEITKKGSEDNDKKLKIGQFANASELSLKRQEYIDDQMKDVKDVPGTPEYSKKFAVAYSQAKHEITE